MVVDDNGRNGLSSKAIEHRADVAGRVWTPWATTSSAVATMVFGLRSTGPNRRAVSVSAEHGQDDER